MANLSRFKKINKELKQLKKEIRKKIEQIDKMKKVSNFIEFLSADIDQNKKYIAFCLKKYEETKDTKFLNACEYHLKLIKYLNRKKEKLTRIYMENH